LPKAIVQGDFHASDTDLEWLLDRRTEETQAIFVEGRSDVIQLKKSRRYYLFLMGILLVLSLQPRRDRKEIDGLPLHSDIDAEVHKIWELCEEKRDYLFRISVCYLSIFVAVFALTDTSPILYRTVFCFSNYIHSCYIR